MTDNTSEQGSRKSYRLRFNFWLDINKPEEEEIADKIELLKNDRQFTATIREGIQLITSLRDGDVELLFELFPWVKLEMMEYFQRIGLIPADMDQNNSTHPETVTADSPPEPLTEPVKQTSRALQEEQARLEQLRADQEAYERDLERWAQEREKQIAAQWEHIEREKERLAAEREKSQSAIEKRLEKLEQLLIQQGNQPIERPSAGRGGDPKRPGGPQSLGNNNLPPPVFDDDEDADLLEVKESEGGTSDASMNFIRSVQRLMEL